MEEQNNRWQINKVHLVNYWKFANETFDLKDGKVFFTGHNGSGKSNIIQLFPFMLNGDRSSKSLNATGNKENRRMEYYFQHLDEDDKAISGISGDYGYICLEFKKRYTEQYITLCVGQKYVASVSGESLKFKGFLLKDGRRVGKDFNLFKREETFEGTKILPYEFKELKSKLKLKPEEIFNNKKEYLAGVNKELFGFDSPTELDEVCHIISQMRNSKITGEIQFSEVKDMLISTLPTIDEKRFESLSNIFKNMEELKKAFIHYKEDRKNIYELFKTYNLYNKISLYSKYEEYCKTKKIFDELLKEYNENKEKSNNNDEDIINFTKNKNNKELEVESLNNEIAILEESEDIKNNKKLKDELERLKNEILKLEKTINDNYIIIENFDKKINEQEKKILEFKDQKQSNKKDREELHKTLNIKNEDIKYPGHLSITNYINIDYPEKIKKAFLDSKNGAEIYETNILECANILKDFEQVEENYYEIQARLEELKVEVNKFENKIENLTSEKELEKENIINNYYNTSLNNKFLKISDDSLQEISKKIKSFVFFNENEKNEIKEIETYYYEKKKKEFENNIYQLNRNIEDTEKDKEIVEAEIKKLKKQEEAFPDRTVTAKNCRDLLFKNNIKYMSLYEAIDFSNILEENERNLLEQQLTDSSILDSLIIPYNQLDRAKEILKDNLEYVIVPKKHQKSEFNKFIIENTLDEDLKEVVIDFLGSISSDENDKEKDYILSPNGFFKNGVLTGYSSNIKKAEYIGAIRRKEKLKNDIIAQENKKKQLEDTIITLENMKKVLEGNILTLENEKKNFPTFAKIDNFLKEIEVNNFILKEKNNKMLKTLNKFNIEKKKYDELLQKKDEKCKYNFKESYKTYFDIYHKIKEYIKVLDKIIRKIDSYDRISKYIEIANEQITDNINTKNNMQKIIDSNTKEKTICELKLKNIEKVINNKEILNKIHQIDNKKNKRNSLIKEIKDIDKEISEKNGLKKYYLKKGEDLSKEVKPAEENLKYFNVYLKDELEENIVYFSEKLDESYKIDSISTLKKYIEIWKKENRFSKKTLEEIIDELQNKFYDINSKLRRMMIESNSYHNENVKFNNSNLNQKRKIYLQVDNEEKGLIYNKLDEIEKKIEQFDNSLKESMQKAVNHLISQNIGDNLINLIKETSNIIKNSSEKMESMNTPVKVSMTWEIKKEYKELNNIFKRTAFGKEELVDDIDKRKLYEYINDEINRKKIENKNVEFDYLEALKDIFDYKKWFNLKIFYQKRGEKGKTEVTNSSVFSGGEKAVIVSLPILSALNFKLSKARSDAFRIMVLDEAFMLSDYENAKSIIGLIQDLDLDFIFNSPKEYFFVSNCSFNIYGLKKPDKNSKNKNIEVTASTWNGKELTLLEKKYE
jgi:energy-coupling factor transporter ATP-binding protein EcfA2